MLPAEGRTVCYFFFKDDLEEQKSSLRAVCTVLHQLLSEERALITHAILNAFKREEEKLFESFASLWKMFTDAAAQHDVVCVFDALDEYREDDMKQFIKAIASVHSRPSIQSSRSGLRCLLTSRPYDHIRRHIDHNLNFEMTEIHLQGDQGVAAEQIVEEIKLVVDIRIDELADSLRLSSDERGFMRKQLGSVPKRRICGYHSFSTVYSNPKLGPTRQRLRHC